MLSVANAAQSAVVAGYAPMKLNNLTEVSAKIEGKYYSQNSNNLNKDNFNNN